MVQQRHMESTKRCLFPADECQEIDAPKASTYSISNEKVDTLDSKRLSPSSVSAYPGILRAPQKKKEMISMSDNGAEVMLNFSFMNLQTPDKVKHFRRTDSLLDGGCLKASPSCSDDGSCYKYVDSPQQPSQLFGLQTSIAFCLGDSAGDSEGNCNTWQAWSYFDSEAEVEDKEVLQPSPMKKSILKNRAFSLDARRLRVQQLRQDLNPFHLTPTKTSAGSINNLTKSRSFSILDHGPSIVRKSKETQLQVNSLSSVFQQCTLPENVTVESPAVMRLYPREKDVCYDSDPEDFANNKCNFDKNNCDGHSNYMRNPRHLVSPTGRGVDVYFEESFCTVAQEFINSTFTLIFHSQTNNESNTSSIVVDGWVERGQSFGESLIHPKWMWKPKKTQPNMEMYLLQATDLLNIKRVLKVDQMDRCRHPFAKPSNCFMIRTIDDEEFFFETESSEQRDRIVYSMKMVIARFGAMVLEEAEMVYEEFFATSDPVPGHVPGVLTGSLSRR
jgi:hypothetical protein